MLNINTKFISSLRDGTHFPYDRFTERNFCKEPTKTCRLADILPAYELERLQTGPTGGGSAPGVVFRLKSQDANVKFKICASLGDSKIPAEAGQA